MCCRFSPLFMSKSPFFGQLPMAKLYAWKREAEGQSSCTAHAQTFFGGEPRCQLCLPRPGCSQGWRGSAFAVFSVDVGIALTAVLESPAQSTLTLVCPT